MGIIQIQGHSLHPGFLNSRSVVLDLGANNGKFSDEIMRRFSCSCIAVEGNSKLAARLRERSRANILHALVGDADRIATFSITANDQCSTIMEPLGLTVVGQEQVQMLSLESLFSKFQLDRIHLLKMDIEGAEIAALDGCGDLTLSRIGQLAVEFHESLGMTSVQEIRRIVRRLQGLGFHWIRGTFSNYEDNLFINGALCPLSVPSLVYNRVFVRYWNGVKRALTRRFSAKRN